MKVLDGMDTFQAAPVLEPNDILAPTFPDEQLVDKTVDQMPGLRRQIVRKRV